MAWPTESVTVAPVLNDWVQRNWAMRDDGTVVLGPAPGAGYTVENTGLFQPAAMSASVTTTYIGNVYGELLIAACMVWLSGALLRNFGAQSGDPQMAMSWLSAIRRFDAIRSR